MFHHQLESTMMNLLWLIAGLTTVQAVDPLAPRDAPQALRSIGYLLFPGFEILDVFGPLGAMIHLAKVQQQLDLYLIAETLAPVTPEDPQPSGNPFDSSFWPSILPTHTFATAPPLDVLFVPGGAGGGPENVAALAGFIAERYPALEYLLTVCTGAGLAAMSGVLDGRNATTNKEEWDVITAFGPHVNWIKVARWVVDGNIWTAGGVTAGLDMTSGWIQAVFGQAVEDRVDTILEYVPHNASWDPFGQALAVDTIDFERRI